MSEMDFLREAMNTWQASIDAFDRSEEASSERVAAAALRTSERLASVAQTLALLSLAEDVRRIADALESRQAADALAESVRIWG